MKETWKKRWSEGIDFNILTYLYEGKNALKYFILFKDQLVLYNNITNSQITLQKEEKIQEEYESEVNEILKANLNYKSKYQTSAIENIKKLDNEREKVIKFYNEFTKMVSGARNKSRRTGNIMEKNSKYLLLNKCFKDYQ